MKIEGDPQCLTTSTLSHLANLERLNYVTVGLDLSYLGWSQKAHLRMSSSGKIPQPNFYGVTGIISLYDGVLYYRWTTPTQELMKYVVPYDDRVQVLRHCHDSTTGGRWGMHKTKHESVRPSAGQL